MWLWLAFLTLVLSLADVFGGDRAGPRLVAEFDCTKGYPPQAYFGHADVAVVDSPLGRYRQAGTAPRETTWADIFATLESIRYLYDNELEKEEQTFIGHLCDDVPALLEGMDGRLDEFAAFARRVAEVAKVAKVAQVAEVAGGPSHNGSFRPPAGEGQRVRARCDAAIQRALDKLADTRKRRDRLAAAAEAARSAARIKDLAPQDVADKKKRFSELWQGLSRAARERADLIRAFRGAARELRDAAAISCAERPELRLVAGRLRQLAQEVLRNRYYFEGEWRGELQREPPYWLGPMPY
jgi:hypothetical protein